MKTKKSEPANDAAPQDRAKIEGRSSLCSAVLAIREQILERRELLNRLANDNPDDRDQLRARAAVLGDIYEALSIVEKKNG